MNYLWGVLIGVVLTFPVLALDIELATSRGGALYVNSSELQDDSDQGYLVDTGSSYVILTEATFRKIQQDSDVEYLRDIRGAFADGRQQQVPIYRVQSLKLAAGCTLMDVEVALVKGADRNVLGMSGLKRLQPFTLGTQPPLLTTPGCS